MADSTSPTPPATPPPAAQNPVLSETEKRYRDAGYARNRAELVYKTAVKDHGADSAEAKDAKKTLDKANKEVETLQKEMQGPKKTEKSNPKPAKNVEKKPEPEKAPSTEPKAPEAPPKGTYIIEHVYEERIIRLDKYIDPKKLEQFRKEFEKRLKELEITPPNNGEMLLRRSQFFKPRTDA
jgi:hypothetical protein